jgi:hypothetical protein
VKALSSSPSTKKKKKKTCKKMDLDNSNPNYKTSWARTSVVALTLFSIHRGAKTHRRLAPGGGVKPRGRVGARRGKFLATPTSCL